MATKLFLRNTTTNGITDTGDGILYDMITTAGSSSDTATTNTTASGTEIQATKTAGGSTIAWISGRVPAGGFTLTTTDISMWQQESNNAANIGGRYRIFKRAANGTVTELGGGPFDDGVEMSTSNREDTWTGNNTDTAFAEDDRILIRYYLTNIGTMGGSRTGTLTFNAADAATGDSFFNINETVSFKANDVSVALTGVSSTMSPGSVAVAHDQALTGAAITGAVGTATPNTSKALTGNQITSALGSVVYQRTFKFSASTFVVSADMALSAYEGQINGLWTKHPDGSYSGGEYNIDAATDRVWQSNTVAYYSAGIPGSADYYAECEVFAASIIAQNIGPAVRMDTTANTMYTLRQRDGIDWQLRKIVAGVQTTLATATTDVPTAGQSKRARICVRGDQLWGEIEGGTVLGPVTDTEITATGRAGIRGAGAASSSTGFHVRDFIASNLNDTSVAATGVSSSAAVGTLTPNTDKALTGNAATSALGSAVVDHAQPVTGNQSTAATGTLGVDRSLALSGVSSTLALGTLTPNLTITVSGFQIDSATGTVTASQAGSDITLALTGVESTSALGSVGVDRSAPLSGVQASLALGIATPDRFVAVSGNAISADVGSVAVSITVSLTGNETTGAVGSLSIASSVPLSGVSATGQTGNVGAESDTSITLMLTGVTASCSVGAVATQRDVPLTGSESAMALGSVGLSKGGSAALTGVQASAQVGSLTPEISPALTGVQADSAIGDVSTSRQMPLSGVLTTAEPGNLSVSTDVSLSGVSTNLQIGSVGLGGSETRTLNTQRYAIIPNTKVGQFAVVVGNTDARVKRGR